MWEWEHHANQNHVNIHTGEDVLCHWPESRSEFDSTVWPLQQLVKRKESLDKAASITGIRKSCCGSSAEARSTHQHESDLAAAAAQDHSGRQAIRYWH